MDIHGDFRGFVPRASARRGALRGAALAGLIGVLAAACGDLGRTGPEFDSQLQVILRAEDGGGPEAAVRPIGWAPAVFPSARFASVPAETVGGLELEITRVEALPQGAPAGDPQAWVALQVTRGPVDLLALPPGGVELAGGGFASGGYQALRLFIPSAGVVLSTTAPTGDTSLPPGEYPASVPAGADFGVEVDGASFTVPEQAQATVTVVVDLGPTLSSLEWTGELFLVRPELREGG